MEIPKPNGAPPALSGMGAPQQMKLNIGIADHKVIVNFNGVQLGEIFFTPDQATQFAISILTASQKARETRIVLPGRT